MLGYVVQRLVLVPVMLFVISFILFWLLIRLPGDAALVRIGTSAGRCDECVASLRRELKLDRPFLAQYSDWLRHAIRGDLGRSLVRGRPIGPMLADALPATVTVATCATVLSILIGVPVGVVSAIKRQTLLDYTVRSLSIVGLSLPQFWVGTLMVTLPAVWWGWSPVSRNYVSFAHDPLRNLQILFWPSLMLAISSSAYLARLVRFGMLEALSSDYVRTAWAKGLFWRPVVLRHALRNVLLPVVTLIGLQFGLILGGSVIAESIFGIPGLGMLNIQAVNGRDNPVILATTMLFATTFMLVTLLVDLSYRYLDPRVRL